MFFRASLRATLMTTALTLLPLSAMAESAWTVTRVAEESGQQKPYCTLTRSFDPAIVTFAENVKGEVSLALDFKSMNFSTGQAYSLLLGATQDSMREIQVKPATNKIIVTKLGQDKSLFPSMLSSGRLNVSLNDAKYAFDVSDIASGRRELETCLAALPGRSVSSASNAARGMTADNVSKVWNKSPEPKVVADTPPQMPANTSALNSRLEEMAQTNESLKSQVELERVARQQALKAEQQRAAELEAKLELERMAREKLLETQQVEEAAFKAQMKEQKSAQETALQQQLEQERRAREEKLKEEAERTIALEAQIQKERMAKEQLLKDQQAREEKLKAQMAQETEAQKSVLQAKLEAERKAREQLIQEQQEREASLKAELELQKEAQETALQQKLEQERLVREEKVRQEVERTAALEERLAQERAAREEILKEEAARRVEMEQKIARLNAEVEATANPPVELLTELEKLRQENKTLRSEMEQVQEAASAMGLPVIDETQRTALASLLKENQRLKAALVEEVRTPQAMPSIVAPAIEVAGEPDIIPAGEPIILGSRKSEDTTVEALLAASVNAVPAGAPGVLQARMPVNVTSGPSVEALLEAQPEDIYLDAAANKGVIEADFTHLPSPLGKIDSVELAVPDESKGAPPPIDMFASEPDTAALPDLGSVEDLSVIGLVALAAQDSSNIRTVQKTPDTTEYFWQSGAIAGRGLEGPIGRGMDLEDFVELFADRQGQGCPGAFSMDPTHDFIAKGQKIQGYDVVCEMGDKSAAVAVLFIADPDTGMIKALRMSTPMDSFSKAKMARDRLVSVLQG